MFGAVANLLGATTDGHDRHRHPQPLDAHAGGDGRAPRRARRPSTATASCCGIGVSHRPLIDHVKEPGTYQQAAGADGARTSTASTPRRPPLAADDRVLAALGPKMLELARDPHGRHPPVPRDAGAHGRGAREASAPTPSSPASRASCWRPTRRTARADRPPPPRHVPRPAQLHEQLEALGLHRRRPRRRRQRPPRRRPRRVGRRGDDRGARPGAPRRRRQPRLHPGPRPTTRAAFPLDAVAGASPPAARRDAVTYDFDRFLRYDELTAWLRRAGRRRTRTSSRVESYGRSHEGRDLWLVTVTDAATGPPRHQAGALGRRQHPRRRADGDRRRLPPAAAPRRRPRRRRPDRHRGAARRARSTSCPGSTPTAPSGRSPTRRGSVGRAPGRGRGPTPTAGRASTSRTSTATAASCRCASPDPDGAWMPHPDDARLLVPGAARPARRPARRATGCSTRARVVDHDGFTIPTPRPPEGLDLNRNFPAGWGDRASAARGDHPLSEPEIDALVRAIVARPNVCGYNAFHTSGGVLLRPSSTQPDSALPPARRVGVEAARRDRHRAHRLPGALGVRGLHVGQGRHDERRRRRLGLRAPRRVRVDDRVLGRRPRGDRRRSSRRDFWYLGPTDEQALAVLRWVDEHAPGRSSSTGTRSSTRSSARSSSAAGTTSGIWTNPPPRPAARRGRRRTPRSPSPRRWRRRAWRSATPRPSTSAAARGASRSASPTPAGCRRTCRRAAPRTHLVRPIVAEVTGDGVEVVGGPARQQLGQLDGPGRAALRATGTTARPTACWRRGSCAAAAGTEVDGRRPPRPGRSGRARGHARRRSAIS